MSLLGSISIYRAYYHCKHCREGSFPWDHTLRLGRRAVTLAVEELSALAGTLTDFDEASEENLQRMCGLRLSESTVRRLTEEAGGELRKRLDDGWTVGDGQSWRWHLDAEGRTCAYVSLDATSVPQQGPGGAKAEGRMAYVAKFYNPDPLNEGRPDPRSPVRYLAGLYPLETMGWHVSRESRSVGFDRAEQQIALSDGGAGLEDLFRRHFPRAEVILDFWHAREHLVDLAQELWPTDSEARKQWVDGRSHQLKHEGGQSVLATLEELTPPTPAACQAREKHVQYFRNHHHKMDYPRCRAAGWQIGSGPVEAACKSVISQRMKRCGMRWGNDGTDALCHLRALHASGPLRWQAFWQHYRN